VISRGWAVASTWPSRARSAARASEAGGLYRANRSDITERKALTPAELRGRCRARPTRGKLSW